jgi:hypothetical protein
MAGMLDLTVSMIEHLHKHKCCFPTAQTLYKNRRLFKGNVRENTAAPANKSTDKLMTH